MASQYEDDESDSSFLASRRRLTVVSRAPPCLEEDEPDENKPLDLRRMIPSYHHQTPVAVIQRRAPTTSTPPPRVAHVTSKSKSPSSNNRKIAKVVDSLLLKKRQTAVKKPAQYRAMLLANLNKLETEKKEEEASDELDPNLAWLTQFNIASTPGFVPLSPPQSPLVTTSTASASRKAPVEEDDECDSTRLHLAKRARLAINSPSSSSTALKKPNITFSCLAFFAIESAPRKRLSVKEIYTWVIENYPYFGNVPSGSWKNSIRHNLASNACFSKVDKNLLAMRDFSGKGSLWCMSPFYRPTLLDALARFGGDRAKLAAANIPCLQDVREQQPPVTVASRTSHERHHSQPASSGSGFRSRSASSLIYNAYPKPTLNPRLLVGGGGPATVSRFLTDSSLSKGFSFSSAKSHVTITNVSKLSKSSVGLNQAQTSAAANQHLNDNYSELDAVKALLSMKSRSSSSSAPISATTSVLTTTATTSSNADQKQEEQPKRGRRKQVFKRPVKTPAIEHDDHGEFGSPKSDEIDLGDLDEQNDDDDDYEADDDDEIDLYPSLSSHKNLKSSSKRAAKHGNQSMCNNNSKPKPGKLLVKFTSFHNKPTTSKGEKIDEKEKRSNDNIESDEESRLRIDEDDDEESQTAANNPLLELSRAAYLVEEKTNTKK